MFANKKILIISSIILLLILIFGVWFFMSGKEVGLVDKIGNLIKKDEVTEVEEIRPQVFIKTSEEFSDVDSDGISDEREKELGLSELEFDTDRDGLSDKMEIENLGTDPTKADTDGDGYSDTEELLNDFNPLGEGKL